MGDKMKFVKKGLVNPKYLADECEFKKINEEYQLISTKNPKYNPFIGEIYREEGWDSISKVDITFGEKHEKLYGLLLDHFKSGQTIFNHDADILLKKGEQVVFSSYDNVILKEPTSVRVSSSTQRRTGMIYGRYINSYGVSKSVSEIQEIIKATDVGQFIITNKRFIFMGDKRNIDVNISQITAITPYCDGFKLQRKNKQKPEYFVNINFAFVYAFKNELYFYVLKGDVVKSLIEGGLNKTPQKSKLDELEAQHESNNHNNFCTNCGKSVGSEDKFCKNCGSQLF